MHEQDETQRGADRVWHIIAKVGVGMLTTRFAGGLRARPLEARPDRDAGIIWFMTDARSHKDDEIAAHPDIGLVFIDAGEKAYLSITGRAAVLEDRAKARAIWKATDTVWWVRPDDPDVRLLRIEPVTAELWDGPASRAVAAFEFAKARLTGEKPNLGENRKLTVKMERHHVPVKRSQTIGGPPSKTYRLVWEAIRSRQQITCVYDGFHREISPIILGYAADGQERVFGYQFAGATSKGGKLPAWRCFHLARVSDLNSRPGDRHEGESHKRAQSCVRFVDVDANIPETLTRAEPQPFGSPHLRAPRGKP